MSGEQLLYNRPLFPAQLDYSHPLTKGLVGCWLLNEEGGLRAFDSSPYKNHGLVTGAKGNYRGRTFDGLDDRIQVGSTDNWMPLGSANRTIMGWLNSDVNGAGNQVLGYGTFAQGQYFLISVTANKLGLATHTNNYNGTTVISINTWYHFAVMIDGANVKSFINGVADINTAHTNLNTTSSGKLYIGWEASEPAGTTWDGVIGEIYVYNRALTALEIEWHYLNPYDMFLR